MKDYLITNYSDKYRFAFVKEVDRYGGLSGNRRICLLSEKEEQVNIRQFVNLIYRFIQNKFHRWILAIAMGLLFINVIQLCYNLDIKAENNSWRLQNEFLTNKVISLKAEILNRSVRRR